jgi:hypothetical protein
MRPRRAFPKAQGASALGFELQSARALPSALMPPFQPAARAWDHWFHIMFHTYGTWLPGDPKGFRTRHRREHVEGDYKNPPPKGKYDHLWQRSKNLMKRDAVYLTPAQRERAVDEFVRSFKKWSIPLRIMSIDRIHFHALARFPDNNPRHYVGLAKKECSAFMKRDGVAPEGGLWAVRCECVPIADAQHFKKATGSIRDHRKVGGVIYEPEAPTPLLVPPPRIEWDVDVPSLLLD